MFQYFPWNLLPAFLCLHSEDMQQTLSVYNSYIDLPMKNFNIIHCIHDKRENHKYNTEP